MQKPPNAKPDAVPHRWEEELADLLADLAGAQSELLDVLNEKRRHMGQGNLTAVEDLRTRTEQLLTRLKSCNDRRADLLTHVQSAGLAAPNLNKLARLARRDKRQQLTKQVKEASARMRLLHQQTLSHWVLAQRSLLHLAQMLEIIATGGRLQATYGGPSDHSSGGALVDQAA
ncbi:MAG: flagellar export chaperone FlgN [Pirellulaceae bacterium]